MISVNTETSLYLWSTRITGQPHRFHRDTRVKKTFHSTNRISLFLSATAVCLRVRFILLGNDESWAAFSTFFRGAATPSAFRTSRIWYNTPKSFTRKNNTSFMTLFILSVIDSRFHRNGFAYIICNFKTPSFTFFNFFFCKFAFFNMTQHSRKTTSCKLACYQNCSTLFPDTV